MSAVERSAPAWGCPGPDWCQSRCYQQTGHRAVDKSVETRQKERRRHGLLLRKNVMKEGHTDKVRVKTAH